MPRVDPHNSKAPGRFALVGRSVVFWKAMDSTSDSLLSRVKRPTEAAAWDRLVQLYAPLLYGWARRLGLQDSDAADLVQDVFVLLVRKLPEFEYEQGKSFRGWLRTVLVNKWRDRPPALRSLAHAGDSLLVDGEGGRAAEEEADYRRYVIGRALQLLEPEFSSSTWKAFTAYVIHDLPAAEVATQLGISPNMVYLAKSRVVSRLRRELAGLIG